MQSLEHMPSLVLNADYRPLNLFPLSTLNWEDTVKVVVKGHVDVVAEYDRVIRSPSISMRLPSVIAMRKYERVVDRAAFTRFNVFLRDRFKCQYCGADDAKLTFDHVVPRSRGGKTTWTNIVAACDPCNLLKGHKQDMQPMKVPREPTPQELMALKRAYMPKIMHESWLEFLPTDMAA